MVEGLREWFLATHHTPSPVPISSVIANSLSYSSHLPQMNTFCISIFKIAYNVYFYAIHFPVKSVLFGIMHNLLLFSCINIPNNVYLLIILHHHPHLSEYHPLTSAALPLVSYLLQSAF